MKLSPLQLLHSQFLGVSLFARRVDTERLVAGTDIYPAMEGDHFESSIELGQPDEAAGNQFALKVSIHTSKNIPDDFPYQFAAQIEGIFHIEHDGDIEERKLLVVINGGSMLIGIVREQLLSLTLRHKNGPMLLPSIDLRGLKPSPKSAKGGAGPKTDSHESKPKPKRSNHRKRSAT